MNPITIPNISIPTIGIPTIGIPSVGFPSASGGGGLVWPAGMKEHIKAWYDPKKQGMTNYDVIEAYVEDFTNWNYVKARGVATISQHKFIITECILKGLSIVEDIQEPYSNLTVRIIGITDNQEVLITDYVNGQHQIINTITEDGIYTIEDRYHFVGFGCNFVGTCNITIEQLPTSILKDLSGNGNHAYLYGGKGKLNSGMGVYQQDFSKLIISRVDKKQDPFSFTVSGSGGSYLAYMQLGNWNNKAFKILANINAKSDYLYLRFRNSTDAVITSVMLKNGENIIPAQNIEGATKAVFEYSLKEGETITITQIPDYPDQLCYDGKMYAVCYGFPILTDYTVMAERTWFESGPYCAFISNRDDDIPENKRGAFVFEQLNGGVQGTSSFGSIPSINFVSEKISWQTKESYNGKSIGFGSNISSNPVIVVGAGVYYTNSDGVASYANLCHGAIIIADRSFTEEEINWLKQNWDKI